MRQHESLDAEWKLIFLGLLIVIHIDGTRNNQGGEKAGEMRTPLYSLRRQVGVSRVVVRCTLMSVRDPLALVVSCGTIVALHVRRRMMPAAVGDVLLVVNAANKTQACLREAGGPSCRGRREHSSCESERQVCVRVRVSYARSSAVWVG